MSKIVNNRIIKTEMIDWKILTPFRPKNLKNADREILQKLINSMCANGIQMSFYVWEKDGVLYIIDGHTRYECLVLLESCAMLPRDSGGNEYSVILPERFSCSFLDIKSISEAKKAVAIFESEYKKKNLDLFGEWLSDLNLDEVTSQINIEGLDLENIITPDDKDDIEEIIGIVPMYDRNVKMIHIFCENEIDYIHISEKFGLDIKQSYKSKTARGISNIITSTDLLKKWNS